MGLKSKFLLWRLRKKKSKKSQQETNTVPVVDDLQDCLSVHMVETMEEIGNAVQYYFMNPNKLKYDFAYELTMEDVIFPVSTEKKRLKRW